MSDLFQSAQEIINRDIRPMIQSDGGDIELVEITEDQILKVRLTGACSQCASSAMTLAFGIEERIKELLPSIKAVQQAV